MGTASAGVTGPFFASFNFIAASAGEKSRVRLHVSSIFCQVILRRCRCFDLKAPLSALRPRRQNHRRSQIVPPTDNIRAAQHIPLETAGAQTQKILDALRPYLAMTQNGSRRTRELKMASTHLDLWQLDGVDGPVPGSHTEISGPHGQMHRTLIAAPMLFNRTIVG